MGRALTREQELIRRLKPLHNVVHAYPEPESAPPRELGPSPTRWLSIHELAEWLDTEPAWIEDKLKAGMPHAIVIGQLRFKAVEVRRWLHGRADA